MKYKKTNVLRLASTVLQKAKEEKLFNSQHNLLITFSGGQDSVFCLLVLFLLKTKTILAWNRKKVLDFSNQYKTKKVVRKQSLLPINFFDIYCDEKSALCHLNNSLVNKYTLLWCNHFWQSDSFFTMEHISKYTFCKSYAIYVFATAKKVLSEQDARNWRHKVTQRSALFLGRERCPYKSIELYLNFVSITKPLLFTSSPKQSDLLPKPTFVCTARHGIPLILEKTKQGLASTQHARRSSALNTPPWSEQVCVQGHNKSDRAEAILFNVIKGTGMNGISTLQWKHTFLSACHSNNGFYPISLDFFKEIQVIPYKPILVQICGQKKVKQKKSSKNQLCVPLSISFFLPAKQLHTKLIPRLCSTLPKQLPKQSYTKTKFWYGINFGTTPFRYKAKLCTPEPVLAPKTSFCLAKANALPKLRFGITKLWQLLWHNSVSLQNEALYAYVPKRSFGTYARQGIGFINPTQSWYNCVGFKETVNSNKLEFKLFSKNSHVKTLYYQLKYKRLAYKA